MTTGLSNALTENSCWSNHLAPMTRREVSDHTRLQIIIIMRTLTALVYITQLKFGFLDNGAIWVNRRHVRGDFSAIQTVSTEILAIHTVPSKALPTIQCQQRHLLSAVSTEAPTIRDFADCICTRHSIAHNRQSESLGRNSRVIHTWQIWISPFTESDQMRVIVVVVVVVTGSMKGKLRQRSMKKTPSHQRSSTTNNTPVVIQSIAAQRTISIGILVWEIWPNAIMTKYKHKQHNGNDRNPHWKMAKTKQHD